jgi:SAM-dependent methyltransferase
MSETARWLASSEGLSIRFEIGDAEALTLEDESFDVVASALGVFLAPDHTAAARELARVCRPGGRLGIVAWRIDPELERLHAPYWPERQPVAGDRRDWGRESYVAALLDHAYEVEFEEGELRLEAPRSRRPGGSGGITTDRRRSWSTPSTAAGRSATGATSSSTTSATATATSSAFPAATCLRE